MNAPLQQQDGGLPGGAVSPDLFMPAALDAAASRTSRLADYCELAKVRLSLLVLVVTGAGFCLGAGGPVDLIALGHTLIGTALVAFAANALNQYLERDYDARMRRTADRPLPAGRLSGAEALAFVIALGAGGLVYLAILTNLPAATLAGATFFLYICAYTPLKRRTPYNTLVGALPGAIPPLIGFAAARGSLDLAAWLLFAILFVWQLPHFFAIAWLYRADYARAGYRMRSVTDPAGTATGRQMVGFAGLLLPVSILPAVLGVTGSVYPAGAAVLGVAFFATAIRFAAVRSRWAARTVLIASIIYLPLLMALMLLDRGPVQAGPSLDSAIEQADPCSTAPSGRRSRRQRATRPRASFTGHLLPECHTPFPSTSFVICTGIVSPSTA